MAEPARKLSLSYEDYLAIEDEAAVRHEFLDGEVFAMAGGTIRHSALKSRLLGQAYAALRGRPCEAYDADLKLRVPETGLASYADLAVICGPPVPDAEDPNAATNPVLLAEVLSPSTEAWDRGGKFLHYQKLPTLRHYLLIDPNRPGIEHYERLEDGAWRYRFIGPGGVVAALDVQIAVDELFADLPEPAPAAEPAA